MFGEGLSLSYHKATKSRRYTGEFCADNHEVVATISPRLPCSATLGTRDVSISYDGSEQGAHSSRQRHC